MERPFRILGLQQIAVGATDKSALRKLWVDVLGIQNLVTGGDVIIAINGTPVDRADDVVRIVSSLKPKDVAVFTVVRNGHRQKLAVTLGERQLPSG